MRWVSLAERNLRFEMAREFIAATGNATQKKALAALGSMEKASAGMKPLRGGRKDGALPLFLSEEIKELSRLHASYCMGKLSRDKMAEAILELVGKPGTD